MKTKQFLINSFIILFIFSVINFAYAERFLIHLPPDFNEAELAELKTQIDIVHDLRPLPWLAVESYTRKKPRTFSRNNEKLWTLQEDIIGYFATDSIISTILKPNDPLYDEQWHLQRIGVKNLWQYTQGEGVVVALLDSGIEPEHPDLKGNILFDLGYDFGDGDNEPYDHNGHGTAMAGLIAAKCNNNEGICGVAPAAKIIPYKLNASSTDGLPNDNFLASDLAAAILHAADSPAKILSLSLVLEDFSEVVQDAVKYAKNKDKIVVAAAGNEGNEKVAFPANLTWVIGVGAFDENGGRLYHSNYGNGLSISAPGANLHTTYLPNINYVNWLDGTSAATALVSGVLALGSALLPTATAPELMVILLELSDDVGELGFDKEFGFGQLNIPDFSEDFTEKSTLNFNWTKKVYKVGEILSLNLQLDNVAGQEVDLYLRESYPIDNQGNRLNLFKVWDSYDKMTPTPYNLFLQSPFPLIKNINLALYGTHSALLGQGKLINSLTEGVYELSSNITFFYNDFSEKTRKIIWLESSE